LEVVPYLRTEILMDTISKMKMKEKVNEEYFLTLAKQNLEAKKFQDAANIIQKFNFYIHFDMEVLKNIIKQLVSS